MYASLASPERDEELHLLKDGKTRCTTGSVVSSLYHLKDPEADGAWSLRFFFVALLLLLFFFSSFFAVAVIVALTFSSPALDRIFTFFFTFAFASF